MAVSCPVSWSSKVIPINGVAWSTRPSQCTAVSSAPGWPAACGSPVMIGGDVVALEVADPLEGTHGLVITSLRRGSVPARA